MLATMHKRTPSVAVVLAAGRGSRLQPHTDTTPKPLLTYKNKSIIEYVLDSIGNTNIEQVFIVTNHLENKLINKLNENLKYTDITFFHQGMLNGSSSGLLATQNFFNIDKAKSDWLLITASDYCFSSDYIADLVSFHCSHNADISISVRPIPNKPTSESSIVIHDSNMKILEIIEKPQISDSTKHNAASLLYIVPFDIFEFAQSTPESPRGEYELPLVINSMIASGYTAKGLLQPMLPDWESIYALSKMASTSS